MPAPLAVSRRRCCTAQPRLASRSKKWSAVRTNRRGLQVYFKGINKHWTFHFVWQFLKTLIALCCLCSQVLVGPLMRIGAYWCVVNSVFTHCGPQYAKLGFVRAPIRRIGAVPHTLTTAHADKTDIRRKMGLCPTSTFLLRGMCGHSSIQVGSDPPDAPLSWPPNSVDTTLILLH